MTVFETGGSNDEGWGASPPPPAADRLWRHPSEMAAIRPPAPPTVVAARGHRFSLGTVVVAGSLGALAMFGTLAALGLVSGGTPVTTGADTGDAALTSGSINRPATTATVPDGVVTVRLTDGGTTTYGTGVVLNGRGDVVTTLRTSSDPTATLSIEADRSRWVGAAVVGSDAVTGLTVLQSDSAATRSIAATATAAPVDLGQTVALAQPSLAAVGARYTGASPSRITSTNSCLQWGGASMVGLLTLTSSRPTGPAEVAVDAVTGDLAGLILPADDNPSDEMRYAVPADLALTVGRQIVTYGHARHGTLAGRLAVAADGTVVVDDTDGTGLLDGDEVLSVDGRPVHAVTDVTGALLGVAPGETTSVTVRRDNRQQTVDASVVAAPGTLAPTTTLP